MYIYILASEPIYAFLRFLLPVLLKIFFLTDCVSTLPSLSLIYRLKISFGFLQGSKGWWGFPQFLNGLANQSFYNLRSRKSSEKVMFLTW